LAATPRAVGGIRLQHALAENIAMSLYGDEVYSRFATHVIGGEWEFDPQFRRMGYLYQVEGAAAVRALEANVRLQKAMGVDVSILDRDDVRERFEAFNFDDVDAAAFSPGDGQIDPYAALMGFRRAAEGLGITYLKDRVVGLDVAGGLVRQARLESGVVLAVDTLVNMANCWAPSICDMVGMAVPIEPMRRQQFFFDCQGPMAPFPAMRHANGFAVRIHQKGFLAGVTRFDEAAGFNWNLDHELFEATLWPELARRCAAFEAIKFRGGWVGHYDMNRLDGNPIIDRFDKVQNFILAAGFSGHGLQHAPAVGRAVKEMILDGGFSAIDLSRLSYRRVIENAPLADDGPKA
jgi:glycine/D-amino acid oxidase-like deaminating enzyme